MRPASAQDTEWPSQLPPVSYSRPQTSLGFRREGDTEEDDDDVTPLFEMLAPRGTLMTPSRLSARPHSAAAVLIHDADGSDAGTSHHEEKRRSRLGYIAPAPDFGRGSSFDYFSGIGDVTALLNERIKEMNDSLEHSASKGTWSAKEEEQEEDPTILAAFRRKQAQAAFDATYLASMQILQSAKGGGGGGTAAANAAMEAAKKVNAKKEEAEKPAKQATLKGAVNMAAAHFSLKGAAQRVAGLAAGKHSLKGVTMDAVKQLQSFSNQKGKDKLRSKTRAFVNEKLMEKVAVYRSDSHKRQELRERVEWHHAMAKKQHPESAIKRNIMKAIAWGQDDADVMTRRREKRDQQQESAKQRRDAVEALRELKSQELSSRHSPTPPPSRSPSPTKRRVFRPKAAAEPL